MKTVFVLLGTLIVAHAAIPDLASLDVSGKAIVDQLTFLAKYTDDPNPAVTRILFTGKFKWPTLVTTTSYSNKILFLTFVFSPLPFIPFTNPSNLSISLRSMQKMT